MSGSLWMAANQDHKWGLMEGQGPASAASALVPCLIQLPPTAACAAGSAPGSAQRPWLVRRSCRGIGQRLAHTA